jgi:hypothetical protein
MKMESNERTAVASRQSPRLTSAVVLSPELNHRPNPQGLARIIGFLYLVVAVFGMFAGTVTTGALTAGNSSATAHNVVSSIAVMRGGAAAWLVVLFSDVAIAVTLYILLKPAGATLSLLSAALRLIYSTVQGVNLVNLFNALFLLTIAGYGAGFGRPQLEAQASFSLQSFGLGFRLALVFFGLHLIMLGYLLFASGYIPRVISVLVVASGLGYALSSFVVLFVPNASSAVASAFLASAAIGELALAFWLLVKGVTVPGQRPLGSLA